MKRTSTLVALVLVGSLSIALRATQGPPPAPAPSADALAVEKVSDNFFVIRGTGSTFAGGNTAVFVTQNGVVLVDTKVKGWGQPLIDKVKTLTSKPISTIINTHTHYDHVSGNVDFPANVQFVSHATTARLMNQANPVWGLQTGEQENLFKEHHGHGLPTKTFTTRMTLGSGTDRVELRYYGRAHTGGDTFVIFPALKIAHVGDVFPNKGLPIMDRNNGGSGVEYAATVDKAATDLDRLGVQALINGHTPAQSTLADLRQYGSFIREFVAAVTQAKKSGQTVDAFAKAWKTPSSFTGFAAANEASAKNAAQVVWDELR